MELDTIEEIIKEEQREEFFKRKVRQEQRWYCLLKLAQKTNSTIRQYIKEGYSFEDAIKILENEHLDLYCCWLLSKTFSSVEFIGSKWYEKANNAKRIIYHSIKNLDD